MSAHREVLCPLTLDPQPVQGTGARPVTSSRAADATSAAVRWGAPVLRGGGMSEGVRVPKCSLKPLVPVPAFAPRLQRRCVCARPGSDPSGCVMCGSRPDQRSQSQARHLVDVVLQSPGQPLDGPTQAVVERRFGHDFSSVRVHTDGPAQESAGAVNALAYTAGHHVVFAASQYAPATSMGMQLLAHELTHVVQQSSPGLDVASESVTEQEANDNSQSQDRVASVRSSADPAIIQRQNAPPASNVPKPLTGNTAPMPLFKVTSFLATGSGDTTFSENSKTLTISAPAFNASAEVQAFGPQDDVQHWSLGFIQSLYEPHFDEVDYGRTVEQCRLVSVPMRDGVTSAVVPWYHKYTRFSDCSGPCKTLMKDTPLIEVSWDDPLLKSNTNSLRGVSRTRTFGTWLIARLWPTGEVAYLKHVEWGFAFSVPIDPAKPVGSRAAKTTVGRLISSSGNGQGPRTPSFDAPIAADRKSRACKFVPLITVF